MKKQIMLGGLLLLLGSCTPQNKANDPNAIDIAVSLEHLTELKTSQLGKQIRYIPLETTDSSLIGNSYSIKLSKDHIFVSTNGRCLSFNKQTGKYLGSIGHKGEDPQGYSNASCFIHPHTNHLYFYRQPDKLVKYDTKGNYLGQVHLPQKISPSLYFFRLPYSCSLWRRNRTTASKCVTLLQRTGRSKRLIAGICQSG